MHGLVDPATLPEEIREAVAAELARAHAASVEPLEAKEVEGILRGAWGRAPGKVLDDFEAEPLAVTPAAQVHRAELDGAAVAVKVRRPGLAALVRSDLTLLDAVAGPLASVLGQADVRALLREVRESVLDELDLEHEASGQRQAARLLRRAEDVTVPRPETELCTEDVLVAAFLDGPTLAETTPADPARVSALAGGVALTDPRPNHVVLLADGGIGLLGAGVARPADKARADAALRATAALRAGDDETFAAIVASELGLLPAESAALSGELARETLGPVAAGPVALDAPYVAATGERALSRIGAWVGLAGQAKPDPRDLGAARMAGQLSLVLARLGAEDDWLALAAG
jgi:ubiquinone biosynthesis protein